MIDIMLRIEEKERPDPKNPSPIKILMRRLKDGTLDTIMGAATDGEKPAEPRPATAAEKVAGALLLGFIADMGSQLQMFSMMAGGEVASSIITPKGAGGIVTPGKM